ncbi:hypothetical protein ABZ078_34985 [Streptomyces sp. NPDC006385]|uniref:hypothetical protein n=1 Tax=Streptomyces sp. NPDC006385 TaxID=3156761 RepID=UPI0033AC09D6
MPGAKGSVALEAEPRPFDKNKDNDKADITLDVADAGSTGGGGSTTSGSDSGSTSSGGSGSSGGSSGRSGAADSTAVSGDLASTGSGSALPLAGAVLLVRRRRAARL